MIFQRFVEVGTALALLALVLLLLVNLAIIVARLTGNHDVADKIIRLLKPITDMFRVGALKERNVNRQRT